MKKILLLTMLTIFSLSNSIISAQEANSVQTKEGRIIELRDPIDKNDAATKNYVDNKIEGIESPPAILQFEGQSETAVMSQKATTNSINNAKENLNNDLELKIMELKEKQKNLIDITEQKVQDLQVKYENLNNIIEQKINDLKEKYEGSTVILEEKIKDLEGKQVVISSGTWNPTAISSETSPTYSTYYKSGKYYRINDLVYINFHMKINITNWGSGYARIGGLPFTASNGMDGQSLALRELIINQQPVDNATGCIVDNTKLIELCHSSGLVAQKWQNGTCWVGFSGCYLTSDT